MYLARYSCGTNRVVCAAVRIFGTPNREGDAGRLWRRQLDSCGARLAQSAHLDFGVRLEVDCDGFRAAVLMTAPERGESLVTAAVTEFARLNALRRGSVELAPDADWHDALAQSFPPCRARLVREERASVGSAEIVGRRRLLDSWDALASLAVQQGMCIAYQANCRAWNPAPEEIAGLRKNLVRLSEHRIPERLMQCERSAVETFPASRLLVDEYLGAEEAGVLDWIVDRENQECRAAFGLSAKSAIPIRFDAGQAFDDEVGLGLHSSRLEKTVPFQRAFSAEGGPFLQRLLLPERSCELRRAVRIFVSYRRDDTQAIVGRIVERLQGHFDPAGVFFDRLSIPAGSDFRALIAERSAAADVVLVPIGRFWVRSPDGRRRLEETIDYVRLEIENALSSGIRVVPLLVDGASMPNALDLPESIRDLAYRNALPIRPDPDFDIDAARLIEAIRNPPDA